MRPIDFEGTNTTYNKPANMTDEQCTPLKAQTGIDVDGYAYICTAWMPNVDDLAAINRGEPIYIKLLTQVLPPMALFTTDEQGEINH